MTEKQFHLKIRWKRIKDYLVIQMSEKRFHFGYVCGDTGLIDEQGELKWFIENVCNINDLKKNWITVCNKLNEVADENEQLKHDYGQLQYEMSQIIKKYNELEKSNDRLVKSIVKLQHELTDARNENEQLKQELYQIDKLIDDLGSEELRRQYEEISNGDNDD